MNANKRLTLAAAAVLGLASAVLAAVPATAAGDTGRHKGCAAHWRNTASWSECLDSPGVELQFQSVCNWSGDYTGIWRKVTGTMNPVDSFECTFSVDEAYNVYTS